MRGPGRVFGKSPETRVASQASCLPRGKAVQVKTKNQKKKTPTPRNAPSTLGKMDAFKSKADLPPAYAGPDMFRWGRVLLSHTLDAARSY